MSKQALPDLVFLDVETTGLEPAKHRVLSIAATRVSSALHPDAWPATPKIQSWYFKPTQDVYDLGEPEAYAVNGFRMDHPEWDRAPRMDLPQAQAQWRNIADFTRFGAVVAHNGEFDRAFVLNELYRHGLPSKAPWTRRAIDTQSYAYAIAKQYGIDRGALTATYGVLVEKEGFPPLELHRAPADVLAAYRITQRALKRLLA